MLSSLKELALILDKTPLAGRATAELPILDTPETAFAIEIGPGELEWAWREMRGDPALAGRGGPLVSGALLGGSLV